MTPAPILAGPIQPIETEVSHQKTSSTGKVAFDPSKHLDHTAPSKVYSMKELGYSDSRGVSPVGVSEPFPLFSAEAIQKMREEVLSDEVFMKHKYSSDLAQCQLRGYAAECAPFIYDAWKNPETLAIISKIAGVDLIPAMDFEIGHVNISVHSEQEKNEALKAVMEKTTRQADEGVAGCPWEDEDPIVDWHTDSYPFVCVTMLSDCTNMIGGETALRKGDGEVVKVRGPQMGSAVILQGRYIEHQALRALGTTERISMVTSFRPRASATKDDTVLTTVRPISKLGDLYHQFAEYRFEILEERLRDANRFMRDQKRATRPFDTRLLKQFIREQIAFLEHMDKEIVEDNKVIKGVTDDSHLVSEDLKQRRSKKRSFAAVE
ncbi:uncharacterized protein BO72DRAFT_370715 [Aspergillus fijiensis CBS 313.89]|uniref:Fe2OG dioxygenase domain-containing protein n=1 Tax=Aspergillus fijiensis CBS 313.89 TaxID=1448319 RepID=A0A8G1RYN1_9EURO|nr:uncharacterized protein BO72DRAFT_370715 [Aspergillus fijiensis CBS 313.89]RAK80693.1 hypothetical protein BO72DRAFT_370715 [Aspergillus fijiensis CBS 313.89]